MSRVRLSAAFMTAFLSLIVAFACAYAFWTPGEFHHSALLHEPAYLADRNTVLAVLNDSCVCHIDHFYVGSARNRVRMDGRSAVFDGLRYAPGGSLVLALVLTGSSNQAGEFAASAGDFEIVVTMPDPERRETINSFFARIVGEFQYAPYASVPSMIPPSAADSVVQSDYGKESGRRLIRIPKILLPRLQSLRKAEHGSAVGVSETFWRMLYLSTVTIATIGYGGIVPTTKRTRLLAAAEAFLGVLSLAVYANLLVNPRS